MGDVFLNRYLRKTYVLISVILILSFLICSCNKYDYDWDEIETGSHNAGVSVHDPSILKENGKYYLFGSHMATAISDDLSHWELIGDGYNDTNIVYKGIFSNNTNIFKYAGSKNSVNPTDDGQYHVWAPDVIYNPTMRKYTMYVSISSTWNTSDIALMSSNSVEGPFVFESTVVYSGFNEKTVKDTDVLDFVSDEYAKKHYYPDSKNYNFKDYPNAIDPCIFFDEHNDMWLVYGSWSGGIFLLQIDQKTGLPIRDDLEKTKDTDPYFGKKILGGKHASIEAPYIFYHPEEQYYYLFVSYGKLNRDGGYQVRVFRSSSVDGEYVDMLGKRPINEENIIPYGLKITGNYLIPSLNCAYMAPGHNSVLYDQDLGKTFIAFHTRFDNGSEYHQPRIHELIFNEEGWPVMSPYSVTLNEEKSSSSIVSNDLSKTFFQVDLGIGINNAISKPKLVRFRRNGTVEGEDYLAEWSYLADTDSVILKTENGEVFRGRPLLLNDEANNEHVCIALVGNNRTLWLISR